MSEAISAASNAWPQILPNIDISYGIHGSGDSGKAVAVAMAAPLDLKIQIWSCFDFINSNIKKKNFLPKLKSDFYI